MLKQGKTQHGWLVLSKSQGAKKERLAATGRVVIRQQIIRDLQLGDVRLVDVRKLHGTRSQ
jgi:hypothetical protein